MNWAKFHLAKENYKDPLKNLCMIDRTNIETLDIHAKIEATEQTDLQITFYCENVVVNNTG